MKVRYQGNKFGLGDGLTPGKVYECIGIEIGGLRIIDDEEEDYLYSPIRPGSISIPEETGYWEIVEDPNGKLKALFEKLGILKST